MTSKGEQSLVVFKQKAVLSARKIVPWTKFYSSLIQYGKNLEYYYTELYATVILYIYIYVCIYICI